MRVKGILCNFNLVLEGTVGKEILKSSWLEILEKISTKTLPYPMQQTTTNTHWMQEVHHIHFCWEQYWQACQKSQHQKFQQSDKSFCSISIDKFGSFKKPFETIASLYELPLFSFPLFCWYKWNQPCLWVIAATQTAKNQV